MEDQLEQPIDITESRIIQADEHHNDTTALLEAIIQQNEENNPNTNLEALILQNEENSNRLVEALKPTAEANSKMAQFLSDMKGEKGDKGEQGEKGDQGEKGVDGKDGKDGQNGEHGIDGLDGKDGKNGRDGKDGEKGRDGKDGNDGKNGKDGKDGSPDDGYAIIKKIKSLKDDDRLSYNDLKDLPTYYKQSPAIGGISHITVLQNLNVLPENLSAQCNGQNTLFETSNQVLAIIFLSLNGQTLIEGLDFNKTGDKQITLLRAVPGSGEELFIKYVQA
jgi:hypothetical protein